MDEKQIAIKIRAAIKRGDVQNVAALLNTDTRLVHLMTPFGTWLHVAASHGQPEIVKLLIGLGADVNAYGGIAGGGALSLAASKGHVEIVQYPLSCGANLDVSEPERNPLFSAIHGGHVDVAKLLIDNGIDVQVKYSGPSMQNMNALAFAQERGHREIAKLLAERQSLHENAAEVQAKP
jgi:uncharacterized protein